MKRQSPESVISSAFSSRIFRLSLIAAAILFPLMVSSSAFAGETIVYEGSDQSMLKKEPVYNRNNSLFPVSDLSNNSVTVSADVSGRIYGGVSKQMGAAVSNNLVSINVGRIGSDVLGGYSNSGNVTENTVEVTGSVRVNSGVYGGQSISGTASGNTVRIGSGATVTGSIYGGENTYGAATGNTVIIDNGVVNSTIMGGRSSDENVTDNTIIIDNAIVKGNVFGGNTNSGIATGNTVIVKGNSDISQTDLTGGYGRISSDNTLQFWSAGLSAQNIGRFQNLQFILPGTIGDGDILLTLTNGVQTNISDSKISVAMAAGGKTLNVGNTVTLLKNDAGINKTGVTQTTMTGVQGVSLDYDFVVNLDPADPDQTRLTTTVTSKHISKGSTIFSTGRLATVGFLNQGGDFALVEGLSRAKDVSTKKGIGVFGAVGGSDMRYDTGSGSSSKASGSHFLVGVAGKLDSAQDRDLIASAYVEAGWGDISGHNAVTAASGDSHYYGLGLITRYQQNEGQFKGLYGQINARIGKASTDSHSQLVSAEGNRGSIDKEATYYGAGAGVGYLKELNASYSLDFSAEYQWTHLNGYEADIARDPYRFDDIDSQRTKVGARLSYTDSQQFTPDIGMAWEHEFSGKANGTTYELSLDELSLKGDSGIVEVGVNVKAGNTGRLSFDANVSGYVGQREGVAGKFRMNYAF